MIQTQLKLLDQDHIMIQSETFAEISYIITLRGLGAESCSCKDYEYRSHKQKNYRCKHIIHLESVLR